MSRADELRRIARIVASSGTGGLDVALQKIAGDDDYWAELIRLAQAQGVGPLLLRRLQEASVGSFNQEILTPLYTERNEVAVHYVLAAKARSQVQATLSRSGIPCLWLKGIVLAESVYPRPELRPMVDIDALVPFERRREALELVQSAGYSFESRQLFDGLDDLKHHYYLESSVYRPIRLELHFRLLGTMDRILRVEDQQWFWHDVEEIEGIDGDGMQALAPEPHLLYLCAHAVLQHGEADVRLLRYYDLDRLLAARADFDWDLLIEGAVRMRWTYAVERALTLTQDFFGTSLPDGILTELKLRRPDDERIEHVQRRSAVRTTTEIVMHDLAAMGWADRVRAAGRIVAPPPSYMRWRYSLDNNRGLPRAYLCRMGNIVSDTVFSIRKRAHRNS